MLASWRHHVLLWREPAVSLPGDITINCLLKSQFYYNFFCFHDLQGGGSLHPVLQRGAERGPRDGEQRGHVALRPPLDT